MCVCVCVCMDISDSRVANAPLQQMLFSSGNWFYLVEAVACLASWAMLHTSVGGCLTRFSLPHSAPFSHCQQVASVAPHIICPCCSGICRHVFFFALCSWTLDQSCQRRILFSNFLKTVAHLLYLYGTYTLFILLTLSI